MNVFFDLDGVVIDSEDLIVRCYRAAGVEAPANVLACEGTSWLADRVGALAGTVRSCKDAIYVRAVEVGNAPLLSGARAASVLYDYGLDVHLLTGAPCSVIDALRGRITPWPFTVAVGKLSQQQKFDVMRLFKGERVYVDDQPIRVSQSGVRVVAYRRQPAHELVEEICQRSA